MSQWINESTNQWIEDSVNQWINASMREWTSLSVNQWVFEWTSESVNQWTQWINEPTAHESMKQWKNEGTDGWINEWMDGRATVLCWATSSLRRLFSHYFFSALSCLRASSNFVASATQFFSSLTCHNAFSSLQLQSRISARVALWSRSTFCATVAMRLAPPSCNPACLEHRSITHASLREAVPMCFVTAGCKPA